MFHINTEFSYSSEKSGYNGEGFKMDENFAYTGQMFTAPTTTMASIAFNAGGALATISQDGKVEIDWERVESVAGAPDLADPISLACARLMIAIRDKTYTAL